MKKYNRILLKLSGESLMGNKSYGIDNDSLMHYVNEIKSAVEMGVEVAVVLGGGNIFRGMNGAKQGFDRVQGDSMGMLATIINSIALQTTLQSCGLSCKLFTSVSIEGIGQRFNKLAVIDALKNKNVVIIGGGTGNPFFTTDTASALRGVEIDADILLKGTRVDGVYTADPEKDKNATKYTEISFNEAYLKNLKVMDLTAFALCSENNFPIYVFDINKQGNLLKVIKGENIGTLVH